MPDSSSPTGKRRSSIPLAVAVLVTHLAASVTLYHARDTTALVFPLVAPGFVTLELFGGGMDAFRQQHGSLIQEAALFGISAGFYSVAAVSLVSGRRRIALAVVVISVLVLALAVMAGFVAMFSAIGGP